MSFNVHARDYTGEFPPTTRIQAARLQEGCDAGADPEQDRESILPWVVACVGFWIIVACVVLA